MDKKAGDMNTRTYICLEQAIKDVAKYDAMSDEDKKKFDAVLLKIPIDDDELRLHIKKSLTPDKASAVLKRAKELETMKNIKDTIEERKGLAVDVLDKRALAFQVAESLLQTERFICVGEPERATVYTYDDGIYHDKGIQKIHKLVSDALGEKATKSLLSECVHHVYSKTVVDALPDEPVEWLCVKNGVLNVLTREFNPHTPEQVHLQKIPVDYNPDAKCPEIEKFLPEVCPKDWPTLKKWTGYCLLKSYRHHNILMAHGETHTGKSTFLRLLNELLGLNNTESIAMQRLETDRFCVGELKGKLGNIFADLPKQCMTGTSMLKSLSGEDSISFDRKFKDYGKFTNYAKMMYSCNKLPTMPEDDDAVWIRIILVTFPNQFVGDKKDADKLAKLTTPAELSGFLNYALEGLEQLGKDNGFSAEVESIRETYIRNSEPIGAFVMDCVQSSPEAEAPKDEVYTAYTVYCREKGYSAVEKNCFFRKLPIHTTCTPTRPLVNGKQVFCVKGFKLLAGISGLFPISAHKSEISPNMQENPANPDMNRQNTSTNQNQLLADIPLTAYKKVQEVYNYLLSRRGQATNWADLRAKFSNHTEDQICDAIAYLCARGDIYQPTEEGFRAL